MKYTNRSVIFYLIGISAVLFVIGCTSERQYRFLSFFFDGVPIPGQQTVQEAAADSSGNNTVATINHNAQPDSYLHKPFADEKCKSCHESGFSNALVKPVPGLCYTCHRDFNVKFTSLHGPVASGNCLMCHHYHETANPKLVLRAGRDLCLYCHEADQVLKSKWHEHIEDKHCTVCHDPHGGENSGLLVQNICITCHKPFDIKYDVLHGPVASGNCSACHSSHTSSGKNKLVRQSQDLCLYCHTADQVNSNPAHKKIKKVNCTDCHNPHGGSEHFMLLTLLKEKKQDGAGVVPKPSTDDDSNSNSVPTGIPVADDSSNTMQESVPDSAGVK